MKSVTARCTKTDLALRWHKKSGFRQDWHGKITSEFNICNGREQLKAAALVTRNAFFETLKFFLTNRDEFILAVSNSIKYGTNHVMLLWH